MLVIGILAHQFLDMSPVEENQNDNSTENRDTSTKDDG